MQGQVSRILDSLNVRRQLGMAIVLFSLLGIVPYLAITQGQIQVGPRTGAQASASVGVTASAQNPLQIALRESGFINSSLRIGITSNRLSGHIGRAFSRIFSYRCLKNTIR
jgi:hypothetical protein